MRHRRPFIIGAIAALSVLAAGCGGGQGSPQAGATTTTATIARSTLLAFSHCMRSNGVPSFPEPQAYAGGNLKLTLHQSDNTPQFRAAMSACNNLLPPNRGPGPSEAQTRTQLADELSFARCMRSHGVAHFPDPVAQGGLSVELVEAQGIDVHSSQVLRVVQTCLPASHGALTAAKVEEALKNAGG
jgi:hypothetical protein